MEHRSDERTETDDRVAENAGEQPIVPATRDAAESGEGGLPPGLHDDRRSPIDPAMHSP